MLEQLLIVVSMVVSLVSGSSHGNTEYGTARYFAISCHVEIQMLFLRSSRNSKMSEQIGGCAAEVTTLALH